MELVQRRDIKSIKSIQSGTLSYKEWVQDLGLFSLERRRIKGILSRVWLNILKHLNWSKQSERCLWQCAGQHKIHIGRALLHKSDVLLRRSEVQSITLTDICSFPHIHTVLLMVSRALTRILSPQFKLKYAISKIVTVYVFSVN